MEKQYGSTCILLHMAKPLWALLYSICFCISNRMYYWRVKFFFPLRVCPYVHYFDMLLVIWLKEFKLKGIVHPRMKMCLKLYCTLLGHPRCKWVCFFIGTDLEKFGITSLVHQWILSSERVPSEWESKQLIKTSQSTRIQSINSIIL